MTASAATFAPRSVRAFRFTGWSADWEAGVIDVALRARRRPPLHRVVPPSRSSPSATSSDARRAALDRAARLLHLVAGVSYYKAAVPPRIEIEGTPPSPATARFLGRLYTQGLGEFAWSNGLPEIGRGIVFPSAAGRPPRRSRRPGSRPARWCRWAAARTRS